MGQADQQHYDWLARSFGQADYRPLSRADIETLERVGESISVAPGVHLFKEGAQADAAFLVEQGEVEVYRGEGRKRRVVARGGPGTVLGDLALFGEGRYLANARAGRSVRVIRFERNRLLPELAVHPGVLLRWLVAGVRCIEQSHRRMVGLMHKPVLAQVAGVLLEERQPDVNLSQSAIAALLGVSRQSVNEALGALRERGVVQTGYRNIKLLDPDLLAEIADSDG